MRERERERERETERRQTNKPFLLLHEPIEVFQPLHGHVWPFLLLLVLCGLSRPPSQLWLSPPHHEHVEPPLLLELSLSLPLPSDEQPLRSFLVVWLRLRLGYDPPRLVEPLLLSLSHVHLPKAVPLSPFHTTVFHRVGLPHVPSPQRSPSQRQPRKRPWQQRPRSGFQCRWPFHVGQYQQTVKE